MDSPWHQRYVFVEYKKCGHILLVKRNDQGVSDHYGCQCVGCVDACNIVLEGACPFCLYREGACVSFDPVPVKFAEPQTNTWLLEILQKLSVSQESK